MFIGSEKELLKEALTNPESFFTCNVKWPLCRFNFTKPHQMIDEFVFKTENYERLEIFQDYFDPNKFLTRMNSKI